MPTVTITPNYQGMVGYNESNEYTKYVSEPYPSIGYTVFKEEWDKFRVFFRFSLAALPSGAIVTQVRRRIYCESAGGENHLIDDHAYGSNGQEDPESDSAQTCYNRCASGILYQNDSIELRTTGEKWAVLSGTICADIQNAKDAVGYFSLAIHEEGDDDPSAIIDGTSGTLPQLEITYEEEIPPPAVGYQYSNGLVSIQVG